MLKLVSSLGEPTKLEQLGQVEGKKLDFEQERGKIKEWHLIVFRSTYWICLHRSTRPPDA